jgi:sarcosine oxidase, subunit gamma
MSDMLTRNDPISAASFSAAGIKLSLAEPMARYSLRARKAEALEKALKIKLPKKIGTTLGGVACLGPDEWLMRGPVGKAIPTGAGLPIAVTDVSDRAICLVLEGPLAAQTLMSGCPLDLDTFAVGRATRTIYETVEIIIVRETEERFHIEVWHSFAPWLWTALKKAASH